MALCISKNKTHNLRIEGKSVSSLAERFGTPLFIVCEKHLRQSYRTLREEFAKSYSQTIVAYSYKANYLPYICKTLKEEGSWAEVVSSLELNIARRIGQDPKKVIFNGPGKTLEELLEAMKWGIGIINVDSLSELKKILFLSKKHDLTTNIGLRASTSSFSCKSDKFGMETGDIFRACELISSSKKLNYVGLHAHLGTQILDIMSYTKLIRHMKSLAKAIQKKYRFNTIFVDIGGGFPVENLMPVGLRNCAKIPTTRLFAKTIGSTFEKEFSKINMDMPNLVIEPGRVVVSAPFFLLLKVIATKVHGTNKIVVVDGGLNILPEAEYYEYEVIPVHASDKQTEVVEIVGPLCMKEDIVARERTMPRVKEGDILAVLNAGGYSVSLSWQFVKPRPAIVAIDNQKNITLIRRREEIQDFLGLDSNQLV